MWGPGSWSGPMWGFWWIFPLIGLLVCLMFVVAMVRLMGGRGLPCMGPHRDVHDEAAELRREIRELREELKHLKHVP